jgi:hypothetical protein
VPEPGVSGQTSCYLPFPFIPLLPVILDLRCPAASLADFLYDFTFSPAWLFNTLFLGLVVCGYFFTFAPLFCEE